MIDESMISEPSAYDHRPALGGVDSWLLTETTGGAAAGAGATANTVGPPMDMDAGSLWPTGLGGEAVGLSAAAAAAGVGAGDDLDLAEMYMMQSMADGGGEDDAWLQSVDLLPCADGGKCILT